MLPDGRKQSDTTQERRLVVYLPTQEMRASLEEAASKHGARSVSQYVVVTLQNSTGQAPVSTGTVEVLRDEVQRLTRQLEEKETQLRQFKSAFSKQERELEVYRSQAFLEPDFTGIRTFSGRLVDLLKTEPVVTYDSVLRHLDIDPQDTLLVRGIRKQLNLLEGMGVVTSTPEGWRWSA